MQVICVNSTGIRIIQTSLAESGVIDILALNHI